MPINEINLVGSEITIGGKIAGTVTGGSFSLTPTKPASNWADCGTPITGGVVTMKGSVTLGKAG